MDVENAMLLVQLTDGIGGGKALEVLHIVAYFASEDIDRNMFLELLGGSEETKNAVELLKRHSLVQSGERETFFLIEEEVQTEVRNLLEEQEKEESILKVAIRLLSKFLGPKSYSHAISVFNFAKEHPNLIKENSFFAADVVEGLVKVNKNLEASNFGQEALVVLKECVSEYHPSVIALQKGLGLALVCVLKPNEALEVLMEVHRKQTEMKGEKHISEALKLIAKVMSTMTAEPETRLRQLVFGDVPISDTNNNSILNLYCEYALMLRDYKWIDEALPILVQVLEKRRQLLHPDDDDICDVEDTIAHIHVKQNEYQEALEVFQKVYDKRKTNLGENCVKTAYSRRGIAECYDFLGMLDEALIEFEAVAEKFQQIFGEDDTNYLISLGKVGYVLIRKKEHEKAYNLYTRMYDKYVMVSGEKNIHTLKVKENIGNILFEQGKIEEALKIWHELLGMYFEVLGKGHKDTLALLQKILIISQRCDSCNEQKRT